LRRLDIERQAEPEELVAGQCQQVGQFADRRKGIAPHHLHRHTALPGMQVELDGLRHAADVGHA